MVEMTQGCPDIQVVWAAPQTRLALRMPPADAAAIGAAAGFSLDLPINCAAGAAGRRVARLGPDEWRLAADSADPQAIAHELAVALQGVFHAVVDISHRDVSVQVTGAAARDVLSGGCPLDLADAPFPEGAASRTLFGKAEVVLWRPTADADYRLDCWRSFGPYVFDLLQTLAQGVGPR